MIPASIPTKRLQDGRIEISHCFKWIFAGIATLQGPVVRMTLYFPPTTTIMDIAVLSSRVPATASIEDTGFRPQPSLPA
jgi:hypothetical protein